MHARTRKKHNFANEGNERNLIITDEYVVFFRIPFLK